MTAKKPAIIRALEGNRGKRPLPKEELPGIGRPEVPSHLTAEQRDRWEDIVSSLPKELLTRADTQVLERMSVAWAAFRQASILINQSGLLTRGANNEPVRNPLLIVRNTAAAEMHECGQALGLSPLARTRLTAPESAEEDPLSILLGPHGKAWGDEHIAAQN
jgi:P27 family predicted phage terminase small subunit